MFTPARLGMVTTASALTLAFLTGCSGSDGNISEDELESGIADQLESITGVRPADVDCPGDLDAEVDATMRCTVVADDGSEIEGTATVTEVDGGDASFAFQVDDELSAGPDGTDPASADGGDATGAPGDGAVILESYVEQQATDQLEQAVGQRPANIDCPGDIEAVAGTTMRCTLTANDGTQFGMTVEVTSVTGDNYHLDFQVDNTPMP